MERVSCMKKFLCGILLGSLCTATVGICASGVWDNISVLKNDIAVIVNGQRVESDNFLYNDTTYLPLRAVSTALGEKVEYDESTNTAYIGERTDNVEDIKFDGKYNPKDYENYGSYDKRQFRIELIDNRYYISESDCRIKLTDNNVYENVRFDHSGSKSSVIYTINGVEKEFDLIIYDEFSYMLFDSFVEELLPLLK